MSCDEQDALASTALDSLAKATSDTQFERAAVMGATALRSLGICRFLADGDVEEAHNCLYRAARVRLHYLVRAVTAKKFDASIEGASYDDQMFDALACQSRITAERVIYYHLAGFSPSNDDPARTAYSFSIRALVFPRMQEVGRFKSGGVQNWLENGGGPRHAVVAALREKDGDAFTEALKELMDERRAEAKAGEPVGEGGGQVHVEGLGLAWLARQLGIKVTPKDALLPSPLLALRKSKLAIGDVPVISDAEVDASDRGLAKLNSVSLEVVRSKRLDPRELG